jgi:excisionase family DNA binding protein
LLALRILDGLGAASRQGATPKSLRFFRFLSTMQVQYWEPFRDRKAEWVMAATKPNKSESTVLTDAEASQARAVGQALAAPKAKRGKVQLRLENGAGGPTVVDVPESAVRLIADLMQKMSEGEQVEVRTVEDLLSTTEAAELLNVSRPYVVKLVDQGLIPSITTEGNHRRIQRADLLEFKRRKDEERRRLADELAAEGQRLNREYN